MGIRRLLWRIYLPFFASTLLALAATAWYADHSLRQFQQEQVAADLLVRARMVARELAGSLPSLDPEAVDRLCKGIGRLTQTRITVVLPGGQVLGDSDHDPATMENHADRPEIVAALAGGTGRSVRFSDTMRRSLMYLALPVQRDGVTVAVARTSLPLWVIDWSLRAVYRHIVFGGLIAAVLFGAVALYLARRITRPLEDMRQVAERLARGDLSARVAVARGEEIGALAQTLNQMAAQLSERMQTIARQSEEQKAVLSSMVEGVLAVDQEERILDLNDAAARLLDLKPEEARGRSIQEAVRNLDLQVFIGSTLAASGPAEGEIVLHGAEERCLQLHGTALTDAGGVKLGALVVLNDITRLKRLETVRRDFVANVSHELKTPITAIKGYVETLADSAVNDPEEARRFLAIVARHADRLESIVQDLLNLSRIEFDAEKGRVVLESGRVREVVQRSAQVFAARAAAKKITLTLDCPEDLTAPMNAALLEQAVSNLIDNAVKYSDDGTVVTVAGRRTDKDVEIRVTDRGPGIEKRHLPRIFERFYRVDAGRSRALGGTGLGLAIVKHIAIAHRGSVAVDSTPGQGSTFTIKIPR